MAQKGLEEIVGQRSRQLFRDLQYPAILFYPALELWAALAHCTFQSAANWNRNRVSAGIFKCGWPLAAIAVPPAPPTRAPMPAPLPPPAMPPTMAPSPAPPMIFPAVFLPSPPDFVSLTIVTTGYERPPALIMFTFNSTRSLPFIRPPCCTFDATNTTSASRGTITLPPTMIRS